MVVRFTFTLPPGAFLRDTAQEVGVSRGTFTGREIVRALQKWNFKVIPGGGKGSHVKMRYVDPNTGEKRTVIVPQGEIPTGTLQDIAKQAGAKDFQEFLDSIEELV